MGLLETLFSEDSAFYPLFHLLAGVGAVNWLLIAQLDFNLVTTLFGQGSTLTTAVYTLAGVGGIGVLGDMAMDYGVLE
jgi:uncharacterized membrane protein YuzA (DUF378 family)